MGPLSAVTDADCGGPAWWELVNGGARGILQHDCPARQTAAQHNPVAVPEPIALVEDDEPVGKTDDELAELIEAEPAFTIGADVPRDVALAMLDALVDAHRNAAIVPAECPECLGTSYQRMSTGDRLDQWIPITCKCQRLVA